MLWGWVAKRNPSSHQAFDHFDEIIKMVKKG
jgi:hypothetical protein